MQCCSFLHVWLKWGLPIWSLSKSEFPVLKWAFPFDVVLYTVSSGRECHLKKPDGDQAAPLCPPVMSPRSQCSRRAATLHLQVRAFPLGQHGLRVVSAFWMCSRLQGFMVSSGSFSRTGMFMVLLRICCPWPPRACEKMGCRGAICFDCLLLYESVPECPPWPQWPQTIGLSPLSYILGNCTEFLL